MSYQQPSCGGCFSVCILYPDLLISQWTVEYITSFLSNIGGVCSQAAHQSVEFHFKDGHQQLNNHFKKLEKLNHYAYICTLSSRSRVVSHVRTIKGRKLECSLATSAPRLRPSIRRTALRADTSFFAIRSSILQSSVGHFALSVTNNKHILVHHVFIHNPPLASVVYLVILETRFSKCHVCNARLYSIIIMLAVLDLQILVPTATNPIHSCLSPVFASSKLFTLEVKRFHRSSPQSLLSHVGINLQEGSGVDKVKSACFETLPPLQ